MGNGVNEYRDYMGVPWNTRLYVEEQAELYQDDVATNGTEKVGYWEVTNPTTRETIYALDSDVEFFLRRFGEGAVGTFVETKNPDFDLERLHQAILNNDIRLKGLISNGVF